MLKASVRLLGVAIVCLLFADIEISTLDPWLEGRRMLLGAVTPDVASLWDFRTAILNTLVFALCGVSIGLVGGIPLALLFHHRAVRITCAAVRAVHEIFWAFIFLPIVGLNPMCGVLAIAVPYAGIFAKVFAEIIEEADARPSLALPAGTDALSRLAYGVFPMVAASTRTYASYRFECALRSSAILGFIGLPTLGFHLETAFREGIYSEAAAILYAFYFLIYSLRWWVRPRLMPVWIAAAFLLLAKDISLRWDNVTRFAYEVLPWPMRREGFLDGTESIHFDAASTWTWMLDLLRDQASDGTWATIVLTQIALVVTAFVAMAAFPVICRHFVSRSTSRLGHLLLIVVRTTPEYVLAYIFVQIWGPSMLPAIVAISLHNGAILGHLTGERANQITLREDAPIRRPDRYGYEVLPRVYGQFLAFLFYRWEIIARESAILGILGVHTLGFFIDSAISDNKLDQTLSLIIISAILNISIDTISQTVRRRLRISVGDIQAG